MIAILTDFGDADPYVGIMKGVIAQFAPSATTIDLTHTIPPGDILRGAVTLWQSVHYFPDGTVFLAVVDPGVGASRRALAVRSGVGVEEKKYTFIGPDNGLFTFVLGEDFRAREIQNPAFFLPHPSSTFHGRDIFAPAAAQAALGTDISAFGPPVFDPVCLEAPRLESPAKGRLEAEVLFADRFGNILTSLGRFYKQEGNILRLKPWIGEAGEQDFNTLNTVLQLPNGDRLPLVETFSRVPFGECATLVGSSGLLEIVANRQSAVEILKLEQGSPITLIENDD